MEIRISPTEQADFDNLVRDIDLHAEFNIQPSYSLQRTMRDGTLVYKVLLTPYYPFKLCAKYVAYMPEGRRKNSICFHGHRAFFAILFANVPSAKVSTWQAQAVGYRWVTKDNYQDMAGELADFNLGSAFNQVRAADLCKCEAE